MTAEASVLGHEAIPSDSGDEAPDGPLAGVVVVDFTQVYMGPCCTQLLGDFGANVIKIERPGTGDLSRTAIPDPDGLDNPVFLSINRNKSSITVDVRSDQGKEIVSKLVATADVVVSNFRSGVMDRMGFGYEACRTLNPRIIWVSGTGFGERGPFRHKGGQDVLAQAYTGLMWRRQSEDLPLSIYPTTLCDYTAGMHLFQGVLLALIARDRDGVGQRVDVSMFDSMLHMQMQEACMQLNRGFEVNWARMPLSGVFETEDGAVCIVGAFKENPLADICAALELEDLSKSPTFSTHEAQMANREKLHEMFSDRFRQGSTDHWIQRLEEQDILCAPVWTLDQALAHEQTVVDEMIVAMEHPTVGSVECLDSPVHLGRTPARIYAPPPRLGEQTTEILESVGYSPEDVQRIRRSGAVG
jgi:crotonobetainyl-CoA:carnitine CoA-transferase CaiB-like acyl-CoA transferase